MAGERQGRLLDRQVKEWLEGQAIAVRYICSSQLDGGESFDPDFMVLQPYPLAIVTMANFNRSALYKKAKRFLNQRISLAERYGRFLPVIIVTPEGKSPDPVPYADGVFSVTQLPGVGEVMATVKFDDEVQRILANGDPGEVRFSDIETTNDLWSRSLSFRELADSESVIPEGSLAHRLQKTLVPLREEMESRADQNSKGRRLPWYLQSRRVLDAFGEVMHGFTTDVCGGTIEAKRFRGTGFRGQILQHIWHSPGGARIVLRRLMASPASIAHKAQELVAEGWLTRALAQDGIERQVLVLGNVGEEQRETETISGINKMRERKRPIGIQQVNLLEGAGWNVCPWDFANIEPSFIKLLKEVSNDS